MRWLGTTWERFAERFVPLIGTDTSEIVEVPYQDLDAILCAVRRGDDTVSTMALLERRTREPIEVRLHRAADQARGVAVRLGRAELRVLIRGGGVRLPRHDLTAFWSAFVHLIRNAVAHGIESPEERSANGKPVGVALSFRRWRQTHTWSSKSAMMGEESIGTTCEKGLGPAACSQRVSRSARNSSFKTDFPPERKRVKCR